MKLCKKIFITLISSAIITSGASAVTIDATVKQDLSDGLNSFAEELLYAVPEASTQQNVWADSHIGNLFPSLFPHFGVGFTLGGTMIDTSGLKKAVGALTGDTNFLETALSGVAPDTITNILDKLNPGAVTDKFVLPTATIDLRLGGLGIPFDLGICAMMTNPSLFNVKLDDPKSIYNMSQALTFKNFGGFNGFIDYMTLGADLRLRLYEGNTFVPAISLGGGYYYTMGNIKIGTTVSQEVEFSGNKGNQTTDMNIGLGFQTHVIFAQLQVSKSFKIVSLFLGARGVLSNTTTSWAWDYKTSNDNPALAALKAEDGDNGTLTANKRDKTFQNGQWDFSGIQPQVYGGLGFNLWKIQLTLGACADVRSFFDGDNYKNFIWSGYFSTHFKL